MESGEHLVTKKFKTWFIQDWGTYPNETMVIVGYDSDEIKDILVKAGTKKEILDEFDDSDCKEAANSSLGFVMDFTNGSSLLWLDSFDANKWSDFDVIVHEIMHLVQKCMIETRGMEKEYEAQAYQLEYLFKNIRNNLIKRYEKHERKSLVSQIPEGNNKAESTLKT